MSDDLKTLLPGREVEIRGHTLKVKPFNIRQIPRVVALARDLMPVIDQAKKTGDLLAALSLAGDPFIELCAMSCGKKIEFFDNVMPDDFIEVASAVLEENHSFFIEKVAPLLKAVMASVEKANQETSALVTSSSD